MRVGHVYGEDKFRRFCTEYIRVSPDELKETLDAIVHMYLVDLEERARRASREGDPNLGIIKRERDKVREIKRIFDRCTFGYR